MQSENQVKPQCRIRSFVLREGRMTTGQTKAFERGWDQFGLTLDQGLLDFDVVFGNQNPVILEIGFGMGASLLEMAKTNPDQNYIGIEVHRPGVGALLKGILAEDIHNIRIFNTDALEVLEQSIPKQSLKGVQLYFPDPWPKKRHHKRRIVQPEFVAHLSSYIQSGGYFHLATDWQPYAEHMLAVLEVSSDFDNAYGKNAFANDRPNNRPQTKFETRGEKLGHGVWDLLYRRV